MAIKFPCTSCGKQLRAPDDAAGKRAPCPHCSAVNRIPEPVADQAPPQLEEIDFVPVDESPALDSADDPFAGHKHSLDKPQWRRGPPWEGNGMSIDSFLETANLVLLQPRQTFKTMRRHGGLEKPLLFGMIGGTIGGTTSGAYWLVTSYCYLGMLDTPPPTTNLDHVTGLVAIGINLVISPFVSLIAITVYATLYHLILSATGGNKQGSQATFRVVAYCFGATSMLMAIPCIPLITAVIAGWVSFFLTIIGLRRMHEIPLANAVLPVLVPFVIGFAVVGQVLKWLAKIVLTTEIGKQLLEFLEHFMKT